MNSDSLKDTIKAYAYVLVVPIVLIMCVIAIMTHSTAKEEKNQIEQEVVELRKQVDIFNANKQLVQADLDSYNNILLSIIPNKEDYFTIIVALEKLSVDTGFKIDQYTISLAESKNNKLALSVEGTGDPATFIKFLQQYKYEGGRLITNEKMEFSTANVGQTRLSLNFYNMPLEQSEQKIEPINPRDINVIREIQQKVAVSYVDTTEIENVEYETKPNPF